MKKFIYTIILLFFILNIKSQVINWTTETGLPAGSTLVDGQVIPNFAGTGIEVTINVNVVNGSPKINSNNAQKVNISEDGALFTLTCSGFNTFDIQLLNIQNLQKGEQITVSNTNNQNIIIEETSSNGSGRMTVDGVAMTGPLPSVITEEDKAVVNERNNGAGTSWTANMNNVNSFSWLYTAIQGTSANEGFTLFLLGNSLPIELVDFDANLNNDIVDVQWQTASQLNNDYFTIEKSTNGAEWNAISIIDGAGNSSSILDYQYFDKKPSLGTSYYRLKQTDFDGQFSYSDIKTIDLQSNSDIKIYPNPTTSVVTIYSDLIEMNQVFIFDIAGQEVTNSVKIVKSTEGALQIDLSNLNAGTYFVKSATICKKIVKQ